MPTPGYVQGPVDSTGKKIDTNELTRNSQTVERQNVSIADPTTAANIAGVDASGNITITINDLCVALRNALVQALNHQIAQDGSANLRVNLQSLAANLTLATVSTVSIVSAVTSLNQLNSMPIRDVQLTPVDRLQWAQSVRSRIS